MTDGALGSLGDITGGIGMQEDGALERTNPGQRKFAIDGEGTSEKINGGADDFLPPPPHDNVAPAKLAIEFAAKPGHYREIVVRVKLNDLEMEMASAPQGD